MEKILDLKKTVAELVEENPEVSEIMAGIGFKEITNPVALNVMGRIMTIPRGAAVKGIELSKVIAAFEERGYQVISDDAQSRQGRIRNFIERLSGGEDLDSVRADFVQEFSHVDAQEIMTAEQTLIKEGMPITEVQRLCDVHSALFHGVASEPPAGALSHDEIHAQAASVNPDDIDALPEGHPLTILRAENAALDALLDTIEGELDGAKRADVMLQHILALGDVRSHYIKKEELLMPILYDYGVTGPSQVMWGIDDEMKRELAMIIKALKADEETLPMYEARIRALTQRIREMIFKEEKILFPLSLRYFTQMEWYRCYHDLPDMGISFGVPIPAWAEAQPWLDQEAARLADGAAGSSRTVSGGREAPVPDGRAVDGAADNDPPAAARGHHVHRQGRCRPLLHERGAGVHASAVCTRARRDELPPARDHPRGAESDRGLQGEEAHADDCAPLHPRASDPRAVSGDV